MISVKVLSRYIFPQKNHFIEPIYRNSVLVLSTLCHYSTFTIFEVNIMTKEKDKHIDLRIDSETHQKLKDLAEYEGRSINGEILYLIRQAIIKHEKTN